VARKLNIELIPLEAFSCCGFPLKSLNTQTALLMAARNLAVAQTKRLEILTLCSACTSVLTQTQEKLKDRELRREVNQKLNLVGREYKNNNVRVKHIARVLLEDVTLDKIKASVTRELSSLKVVPHYGCHYLKPSHIYGRFDNPEAPNSLHQLISATGAKVVEDETLKTCCGGGVLAVNEELALSLAGSKLAHLSQNDVDALIVICPFCSVMYDDNQRKIAEKAGKEYTLPVLYYTQLLGLALGLAPKEELGVQFNKVKPKELLSKIGG
jgi:heterodisulfide reductase subunit B